MLFPSVLLSQIIEMIDSDILFTEGTTCEQKNRIIYSKLIYESKKYPILYKGQSYEILHISRDTKVIDKIYPNFHIYFMKYSQTTGWRRKECNFPKTSGLVTAIGSGAEEFKKNYTRYQIGVNKDTSRNVFHCFVDSSLHISDSFCGGSPQLVGLYRKPETSGKYFGIVYNNKRYFAGTEIPKNAHYDTIEWRNKNFEITDGVTKKRLEGAEQQPDFLRRK